MYCGFCAEIALIVLAEDYDQQELWRLGIESQQELFVVLARFMLRYFKPTTEKDVWTGTRGGYLEN